MHAHSRWRNAAAAAALALAVLTTGCTFSRIVTNAERRDLDLSFIELGKTHWQEVLERLGPPDVPVRDLRSFTYTSRDTRQSDFLCGFWFVLPFTWQDNENIEETLIEMDERGRVEHVVRSRRGVIRPPLEDAEDRPAAVHEVDQVGGKS